MSDRATTYKSRMASVDVLRIVAIYGVIWLHSNSLTLVREINFHDNAILLTNYTLLIFRLGVPLFFIFSGYFYCRSLRQGVPMKPLFWRYSKRLLGIFLFWYAFYFIADNILFTRLSNSLQLIGWAATVDQIQHNAGSFLHQPLYLLPKYQLWFLFSLWSGIACTTWLISLKKERMMFLGASVLYLIALILGAYSVFLYGKRLRFETLAYTPFYSMIFIVGGYYLANNGPLTRRMSVALLIGGLFVLQCEHYFLGYLTKIFTWQLFLIGSVPISWGALSLALHHSDWLKGTIIPHLGTLTLGVYLLHPFVLERLIKWVPIRNFWVDDHIYSGWTYIISIIVALIIMRLPFCRKFIV